MNDLKMIHRRFRKKKKRSFSHRQQLHDFGWEVTRVCACAEMTLDTCLKPKPYIIIYRSLYSFEIVLFVQIENIHRRMTIIGLLSYILRLTLSFDSSIPLTKQVTSSL